MNETPRKHRRQYRRAQYQPEPEPQIPAQNSLKKEQADRWHRIKNRYRLLALLAVLLSAADCAMLLFLPGQYPIYKHVPQMMALPILIDLLVIKMNHLSKKTILLQMGLFTAAVHFAYCYFVGISPVPLSTGLYNQTSPIWGIFLGLVCSWTPAGKRFRWINCLVLLAGFLFSSPCYGFMQTFALTYTLSVTPLCRKPLLFFSCLISIFPWMASTWKSMGTGAVLPPAAGYVFSLLLLYLACTPKKRTDIFSPFNYDHIGESAYSFFWLAVLYLFPLLVGGVLRASAYGPGFSLL